MSEAARGLATAVIVAPIGTRSGRHPCRSTATFTSTVITKAVAPATHTVEGTLDLHGTTKSISFPATVALDASSAKGKAEFTINRKDFGIVYPGMPDDLIKDEVLLKIDLAFKRS